MTYRMVYGARSIFMILASFSFSSCDQSDVRYDPKTWDSANGLEYDFEEFEINILDYKNLPYVRFEYPVEPDAQYDSNGVPLYFSDGTASYHPTVIAQNGLVKLHVFYARGDSTLVESLAWMQRKLEEIATVYDSALFYAYDFDFPLHGFREEMMLAPWYSGMAQGQILSFYCRLFEHNGDSSLLSPMKKTFNSFLRLKGSGAVPWVTSVDSQRNLWIEEYPMDQPAYTLNGMIFAMFGLYDYYRITGDSLARELLLASITTIKRNILRFRNPGSVSSYCLKHNVQSEYYHFAHVQQLYFLYLITGDKFFKDTAEQFMYDHGPPPAGRGISHSIQRRDIDLIQ